MDITNEKRKTNKENKRDRFVRNVERRVNKLLEDFDSLAKCSNKRNYEYEEKDVKKIFITLEKKLKEVRSLFQNPHEKKINFKLNR